ncbi:MAG TPA: ATP-binding protein, partial [bacterium]|nr:ATP-binding protein [bacterium]
MTIRQKAPDSKTWSDVIRSREHDLLLADTVERVTAVVRDAVSALPGIGRGMVWLGSAELRAVAEIHGPESGTLKASDGELAATARRAVREKRLVRDRGSQGARWAAPLGTADAVHGVVAAVGEHEAVPGFLASAGPALARECGRSSADGKNARADARARSVERSVEALDAIIRDGRTDAVLRRVTTGFACIAGLGKATLWELRAEDGRYVEVARSRNGKDDGFPSLPPTVRRAMAAREWLNGLERFGGAAWIPASGEAGARPEAGDLLVVPLAPSDGPHSPGLLLAGVDTPLDRTAVSEEIVRWAALARLALETGPDKGANLNRLEELRQERFEVAELHRLKSQFIAAVSHELRTPLTSISAYAETLRESEISGDVETREKFLRVIYEESRRLARIVDDILDVATMDSGRVRLSCRRVDLGQIAHDALDVIHPIAGRKGIRIVPPTGDPAPVHADPDLLKQLVVNLLENAVKFTSEGGEVRIRIEPEASAVRLLVEDNGPGIPEGHLDAIFERFYQVDGTDSREHGGSGLGLAICRSIVTWHDGRIWAESAPGEGTTIVVSLPRLRAVSRVRAEPVEEATARQDEHRVPELMIEMIAEIVGAETVSLMLLDEEDGGLYIQAAMGLPDQAIRDVRVALGESICGRVAETGEAILIPDIEKDGRFSIRPGEQYRTRSLLSVPVSLRDRTI